jgi:hypothetical protein
MHSRRALEQIGTSDIAYEDEVSGERSHRLRSRGTVGNQQGQVLRRVPRNVNHSELYRPDTETRTITQQCRGRPRGVSITPVVAPGVGQIQPSTCVVSQLARAGDEVRMYVRFGDVGNPEPLGLGRLKVRIDVPVGVDHERLATHGAAEEVACLRELGVVEAS